MQVHPRLEDYLVRGYPFCPQRDRQLSLHRRSRVLRCSSHPCLRVYQSSGRSQADPHSYWYPQSRPISHWEPKHSIPMA
ncbi:hypothetical protein D6D25_09241 [Aureobasidium pullulans]|nr:hypothetical protein D6D25_09241 [Aureobasidium pullulans]